MLEYCANHYKRIDRCLILLDIMEKKIKERQHRMITHAVGTPVGSLDDGLEVGCVVGSRDGSVVGGDDGFNVGNLDGNLVGELCVCHIAPRMPIITQMNNRIMKNKVTPRDNSLLTRWALW